MNLPVQPLTGPQVDAPTWNAHLNVTLRKTARGTKMVQKNHQGPLYVQKAFYPEGADCAHLYLLHPPGGMVSGDQLTIRVESVEQAHVLVTTPGAGRVYRARPDGLLQQQTIELVIGKQSALEWMPLETILFPSSKARLETRVDMSDSSTFIGWDIVSLGLPANGIRLNDEDQQTTLKQGLKIYCDGRLLLNERLKLTPDNNDVLNASAGYRQLPVHGLLVAGPFADGEDEALMAQLQTLCDAHTAGASKNGFFITVRYLGTCSEKARLLLTEAWKLLRPALMQRPACAPRIWAT